MNVQWEEMEKEGDRMGDRPGGAEKKDEDRRGLLLYFSNIK